MKNVVQWCLVGMVLMLAVAGISKEEPLDEYAENICIAFDSMVEGTLTIQTCNDYLKKMKFKNYASQAQVLHNMCEATMNGTIHRMDFVSVKQCEARVKELLWHQNEENKVLNNH